MWIEKKREVGMCDYATRPNKIIIFPLCMTSLCLLGVDQEPNDLTTVSMIKRSLSENTFD